MLPPNELVPQYFSSIQQVPHTLLSLLSAAKGKESLALQVENVLFFYPGWAAELTSSQYVCQFTSDDMFVLSDIAAFNHHINSNPHGGQSVTSGCVDLLRRRRM